MAKRENKSKVIKKRNVSRKSSKPKQKASDEELISFYRDMLLVSLMVSSARMKMAELPAMMPPRMPASPVWLPMLVDRKLSLLECRQPLIEK